MDILKLLGVPLVLLALSGCQSQLAQNVELTKELIDYVKTADVEADVSVHLPTDAEAYAKQSFGVGSQGGYISARIQVRREAEATNEASFPVNP